MPAIDIEYEGRDFCVQWDDKVQDPIDTIVVNLYASSQATLPFRICSNDLSDLLAEHLEAMLQIAQDLYYSQETNHED